MKCFCAISKLAIDSNELFDRLFEPVRDKIDFLVFGLIDFFEWL